MARYILIDNESGYIFGDSADFKGRIFGGTALEFAEALDLSLGKPQGDYQGVSHAPYRATEGYLVYRADIDGGEAVTVVHDGQDAETVATVKRDCRYLGYILRTDKE